MIIKTEQPIGAGMLVAVCGDITAIDVDVVVNAANEQLVHGGGVAAAIAAAAGPVLVDESEEWVRSHGPLRNGKAAVTSAGRLPAQHVIHVVGPRYRPDQDNAGMLHAATVAALAAATAQGADSVAIPAISAGIFGYPPDEATAVIASAAAHWLRLHGAPSHVLLVGNDEAMAERFAAAVDGESFAGPGDEQR